MKAYVVPVDVYIRAASVEDARVLVEAILREAVDTDARFTEFLLTDIPEEVL